MTTTESKNHSQLIERIVTGCLGAALLALQGVNISETGTNTALIERVEKALSQQAAQAEHTKEETDRIEEALQNQREMIKRLDALVEAATKKP